MYAEMVIAEKRSRRVVEKEWVWYRRKSSLSATRRVIEKDKYRWRVTEKDKYRWRVIERDKYQQDLFSTAKWRYNSGWRDLDACFEWLQLGMFYYYFGFPIFIFKFNISQFTNLQILVQQI